MGVSVSSPNRRDDYLLFPPEILEKLMIHLSVRDKLIARLVCRDWNFHVRISGIEDDVLMVLEDSDEPLNHLVSSENDPLWSCYSLRKLDLSRNSMLFWTNYSEIITHLHFFECSIIPRNMSDEDLITGMEAQQDFYLGCPNLKYLGMQACDKYFMMGGKFFHLHHLLYLRNLQALDLSDNKYLTDCILFSLLLKTTKLKSLNLSSCPVVFMNAVHNRFYPGNSSQLSYSDNILTFKMLHSNFLSTKQGAFMEEIILSNTRLDANAIAMIRPSDLYKWTSINFNRCFELKMNDLVNFLKDQRHVQKLEMERTKIANAHLDGLDLSEFKHLKLSECSNLTNMEFLQKTLALQYLDISSCVGLKFRSEDLSSVTKLEVLKIRSIIPFFALLSRENIAISNVLCESFCKLTNLTELDVGYCGSAVNDNVAQAIIKNLNRLKILRLTKSKVTDAGLAGVEIDEHDPRLSERQIEMKRASLLPRISNQQPGYCLTKLICLKVLDLGVCEDLSEATWKFALKLPNLVDLDLSNCTQLSRMGALRIIQNCRNLEIINVSKCGLHITGDELLIFRVRQDLPRLKKFIL